MVRVCRVGCMVEITFDLDPVHKAMLEEIVDGEEDIEYDELVQNIAEQRIYNMYQQSKGL